MRQAKRDQQSLLITTNGMCFLALLQVTRGLKVCIYVWVAASFSWEYAVTRTDGWRLQFSCTALTGIVDDPLNVVRYHSPLPDVAFVLFVYILICECRLDIWAAIQLMWACGITACARRVTFESSFTDLERADSWIGCWLVVNSSDFWIRKNVPQPLGHTTTLIRREGQS